MGGFGFRATEWQNQESQPQGAELEKRLGELRRGSWPGVEGGLFKGFKV